MRRRGALAPCPATPVAPLGREPGRVGALPWREGAAAAGRVSVLGRGEQRGVGAPER